MSREEIEKTINELKKVITTIGDINFFGDNRSKALNQKKINESYDRLFNLKKHLEFLIKFQ